jgi:prolipoprotein diacylglyceryltransferase
MNSEIIGKATDVPWAFKFVNSYVADPLTPRHPAQLYEALAYLAIFVLLFLIYQKSYKKLKEGFIFGLFLISVFSSRFIIEFFKENQSAFEQGMALNMGQLLSIPLILWGFYLLFVNKNLSKTK